MRQWSRATEREYRELDLLAHGMLAAVPLHDVWRVSLAAPSGDCGMLDVRRVAETMSRGRGVALVVSSLFAVRRALGQLFRWDAPGPASPGLASVVSVPEAIRESSLVPPGTLDGPFRVAYVLDREAMSEIRNATVEAYLVWGLETRGHRYDLFFAIHVRPTSRWTAPYLALIEPFRRFIVYPSLLGRFHKQWHRAEKSAA